MRWVVIDFQRTACILSRLISFADIGSEYTRQVWSLPCRNMDRSIALERAVQIGEAVLQTEQKLVFG